MSSSIARGAPSGGPRSGRAAGAFGDPNGWFRDGEISSRSFRGQDHRHEERGVFVRQKRMGFARFEIEQLTWPQIDCPAEGGEGDTPLKALDGDSAGGGMDRNLFALRQHEP
jgi:hypothetical protein